MTVMKTAEAAIPDLSNPETFVPGVPHAAFDAVRSRPGLYWQPAEQGTANGGFWAVTRFEDILDIEKNTNDFTSQEGIFYPSPGREATSLFADNLAYMDPPRHGRVRRAAAASFGPRVVANFENWVREIVEEALDDALPKGEFDWVEEIAKLVPSRVVARILGVPPERREDIVEWTDSLFKMASLGEDFTGTVFEVWDYIKELQADKLRNPADDMTTILAQFVERGELEQLEFQHYVYTLMVAGYETTHTLIGQSMRMFLEDPNIAEISRDFVDQGNTLRLVDEFLRHVTPAMHMVRTATRDLDFKGTRIRKDDMMVLYFVAANRDETVFSDPHSFNPGRAETAALAFGSGVHRCIGNSLARLEVRIVFEELIRRGVGLELAGEPKRGLSTWINQLFSLPVRVV